MSFSVCTAVGWVCNKIPLCTSLDGTWATLYEKGNSSNKGYKKFTDEHPHFPLHWHFAWMQYSSQNNTCKQKPCREDHQGALADLLTRPAIAHTIYLAKNEHWQLLPTLIVAIIIRNEGFGDCQMTEITKMYQHLETTGLTDCTRRQKG